MAQTLGMRMLLNSLKLILPALIPSWRFFSAVAPSPRVEYALSVDASEPPHDWQEYRPRPDHVSFLKMLRRMLWNPHWNEALFLVSCSERLIAAPTQHTVDEIRTRVARDVMRGGVPAHSTTVLYFRLVFWARVGTDLVKTIEYESEGIKITEGLPP